MSLETMRKRIDYYGGPRQDDRMVNDKTRSLKKALLYSQQAEVITIPKMYKENDEDTEKEIKFRCLINKEKQSNDYDEKILAIPFEDSPVCEYHKKVKTNLHGGDIIHWNKNNTDWIIYLIDKDEDAYFRAKIRKCHDTPMNVNGIDYKFYLRGPVETDMDWAVEKNLSINIPNYSLVCYIKKDENTLKHLKKGRKVKIDGNTWEIQVVNMYGGDGILILYLEEYYNNKFENEVEETIEEIIEDDTESIDGPAEAKPYGTYLYKAVNVAEGGEWTVDNPKKVKIISDEAAAAEIYIMSGKSGSFTLTYTIGEQILTKEVKIASL